MTLTPNSAMVALDTIGSPGGAGPLLCPSSLLPRGAPREVRAEPGVPEAGAFRYASKLERRIARKAGEAVADFSMIEEGDRVMVCMSGGKDSYTLLDMLRLLRKKSPVRFELLAVNVDQGWHGYRTDLIQDYLARSGIPYHMERVGIREVVEEKLSPGSTPCALCSRLRRGVLYGLAARLGCTKIALGHHLDDLIETLCLNLFFTGQLKSMPPRLQADDGRNVVIRPLAYVLEEDVKDYARQRAYPIVACGCPVCGLPDQQRQVVKRLLRGLEAASPGLKLNMLAALKNVRAGHLLDLELVRTLNGGGASGPGAHGRPGAIDKGTD